MSMIFGEGTQAPTRLNSVKITQSCLGLPYATVLGTGKVQQALLWTGDFSAYAAPSGGKGGGKGASGYIYQTDLIAALCNGPILAVKDFWSDQSWIANNDTSENYTITSGIYTPTLASSFVSDHGVSVPTAYSQVFSDLNAPGANTLSGSDNVPMTLVPYGSPLNQGEYSINTVTIGSFTLSSCGSANTANAYAGPLATTYNGVAFGAASSLVGYTFLVTGFTNANNNGTFLCIWNSSTQMVLVNTAGVAEVHSALAAELGVQYYFSAADVAANTQVVINYSYNLPYIYAQENDIIPPSRILQVGAPWWFVRDYGVVYYSSGDVFNPLNGTALTPVATNPPTITGTYHFITNGTSANGAAYVFAPGDVNQEVQITYQYQDMQPFRGSNGKSTGIPEELSFLLFTGAHGQSPWSLLTDSFPGQVLGYSNTAYVGFSPMNLGEGGQIHNNTYEVQTPDMYGGGIIDCNLVQCLWQVLTNPVWGLGSGFQPFPADAIDNGPLGTWGFSESSEATSFSASVPTAIGQSPGGDWFIGEGPTGETVHGSGSSAIMYVKGFNFSSPIPSDATIVGLAAFFRGSTNSNLMQVNIGTNYSPLGVWKEFNDTRFTGGIFANGTGTFYNMISFVEGGVGDLWGYAITPSTLASSNFSVMFQFVSGPGYGDTYMAFDKIVVYYTSGPNGRITNSTAWNWSAANSYFISPVLDKQDSAASIMGDWLEAGLVAAFMSEGLLKLVPYGDTSAAGNGCTWVAPSAYVVALDDTCFVRKEGEDPVKISRSPWQDAHNNVQIKWDNRNNQYAPEITPDSIQSSIDRYGLRLEDPVDYSFIHTLTAATFAASMRVNRGVNIRNSYNFTLPFTFAYLEPMDIVTITTSSNWNTSPGNINLNIVNRPVRLQKIVDDPVEGLIIDAEDYPYGVGQPVLFNKGISSGAILLNAYEDPGNSEVVMFEATDRLTGFAGNQIWIGALGASSAWGGCQIWASRDGDKYAQIGEITTSARIGELDDVFPSTGVSFPSGTDPDTVNSLVVNMVENAAALDAGTTADADTNVTLCFVDGELISYTAITITGQDQYTLNDYIRRGVLGSKISSHNAGGLFMRLDNAIFKYTYDPTWAGTTLYFKFLSFNSFEKSLQLLENVAAVAFTVPGQNPGTVEASSGLVIGNNQFNVGAGTLGWAAAATSTDSTINYGNHVTGSNSTRPGGTNLQYTYTRWTGYLVPSTTGSYTLGVNSDDGANLYICGQSVFTPNLSASQSANATAAYTQSGTIMLTKGVYYPIVLEWQKMATVGFPAQWECQLLWTPPSGSIAVIPSANLSTQLGSVTGNIIGTWWNGTSGQWFPAGPGVVDLASNVQVVNNSMDNVNDGSTYVRIVGVNSDHTFHTSTAFVNQGSIACVADHATAAPTYTSTTTSVTWSWSTFTIYGTNGSTWTASAGTAAAITGLTASHTYFFSMYAVLGSGGTATIVFLLSDKGSPVGTAAASLAQQMAEVNADGNVPVLLNIEGTTPASGSGSGGGGGTGCFTGDTLVKTDGGPRAIIDVRKNDFVFTAAGTWRPVLKLIIHEAEPRTMHRLPGGGLVTYDHQILVKGEWVKAGLIFSDTVEVNEPVYTLSVFSEEQESNGHSATTEHSFELQDGTIATNLLVFK